MVSTEDVNELGDKKPQSLPPIPKKEEEEQKASKATKKKVKSKKRTDGTPQKRSSEQGSQILKASEKKRKSRLKEESLDASSQRQSDEENKKINISSTEDRKKKTKTKSRRKQKKISDSTFSLENDFQPEVLRELQDDILSDDNFSLHPEDLNLSPHPLQSRILTPSKLSSKIYVERSHGFTNVSQKKAISSQLAFTVKQPESPIKKTLTALELGLQSQKKFRSFCIFCHGLLAGIGFLQILSVHIPGEGSELEFLRGYSPMSQPLQVAFYLLTVICTVSVLDRYDISNMNLKRIQSMITFQSGGLAVVIYSFSLLVTLATTRLDDQMSLFQHNATMFSQKEMEELESQLITWKALNLCRCASVILGWMFISCKPSTDLLVKHLMELAEVSKK